jgi:hypothetical protein
MHMVMGVYVGNHDFLVLLLHQDSGGKPDHKQSIEKEIR